MSQHVDSTASLHAFQPNVSILLAITLYSVSLYPYKFKITFFFWYLLIPIWHAIANHLEYFLA